MRKKLFIFFICITLSITLISCTSKENPTTSTNGNITEGELYNIIKSTYNDCSISYNTNNNIKVLDIKINIPKSTKEEELNTFNKACDSIATNLNDITYYSGIIFTLQIDGNNKAYIKSYSSNKGKFELENTYIDDINYK